MKKFSNKILLIALVVLIGIFALSRIFRSPALESNLQNSLVTLDTVQVTQIKIKTADSSQAEISLVKEGGKWMVNSKQEKATADKGSVLSMLGVLKNMQAQRMVSRKEEKWDTYNVGENSTRVSVFVGENKKTADLRIGKTGFNQSQGGSPYGRGGSAYTYVRLSDEPEVYVMDGFLASHFNRSFNDWRNKAFMRLKKDDVTSVQFNYPDSVYVLEKKDSLWMIGGTRIENSKVDSYLIKLQSKNLYEFADQFSPPGPAKMVIQVNGPGGTLGTMQAWNNNDEWIVTSSLQNGVYFKAGASMKDMFASKSIFE